MPTHKPNFRKPQYIQKGRTIQDLSERMGRANAAVLVEYRGLTVKDLSDLRARLRKVNGELVIAKNTLLKRAAGSVQVNALDEHLEGPTAVVFAYDDALATVKAVSDFVTVNKIMTLKAGYVEGRGYGADEMAALAKMPPREQIYARLLGALQAPAASLVAMLQAPAAQLVFTLQAIAEKSQAGEVV